MIFEITEHPLPPDRNGAGSREMTVSIIID